MDKKLIGRNARILRNIIKKTENNDKIVFDIPQDIKKQHRVILYIIRENGKIENQYKYIQKIDNDDDHDCAALTSKLTRCKQKSMYMHVN